MIPLGARCRTDLLRIMAREFPAFLVALDDLGYGRLPVTESLISQGFRRARVLA